MAIWQGESKRKPTGGRLRVAHKKRKFEIGREPHLTAIGETKRRTIRIRGGHERTRVLSANEIHVTDPATGKTQRTTFRTVVENPANIHYVRRNIVTKGAVVDTPLGRVRVTSRPGQAGSLNGILVK